MRAIVAHDAHDFRLEELLEPQANGGAVLRVEAAGVCAADRMIYGGRSPWELQFPFVPGHEFVGTVSEIESSAQERWGVEEGDLVTAEVIVPCGECRFCLTDRYHLCRSGSHLGSGLPGGWAELMHIPARARVHRIPASLDPWQAVLVEPISCGIHAARRAEIKEDDVVVVSGLGPIGAGVVVAAAQARPALLVALVRSPARAELAKALGADMTVNVLEEDARSQLKELGHGIGPDAYIEASGSADSLQLGLELLAPGGRLVVYGVYEQPGSVDWNLVAEFKELTIRGGHLSPGAFPEAIELLASAAIDPSLLVSHRQPLDAFLEALEPSDGRTRIKAIIEPNRQADISDQPASAEGVGRL